MKEYTYYIYHVKGVKIGLTTDIERRMEQQGFTEYEVLMVEKGNYDYGWVMGDIELKLQKEYGYKVDNSHYMISRNNRYKFGNPEDQSRYSLMVKNRHIFERLPKEVVSENSKRVWREKKEVMYNAALENIKKATASAAKSPNRASLQLYYCEDCDKDIKGAGAAGRHGKSNNHKTYKKEI